MKAIMYNFNQLPQITDSKYLFQWVKNRELGHIYHSHDFYEWIVVLEGSCTHIVNEKQALLNQGDVVLLCPGDRHTFPSQSGDLHLICLSVDAEEMQKFETLFDIKSDAMSDFSVTLNAKQTRHILDYYDARCESDYKMLMAHLFKIYADSSMPDNDIPFALKKAMAEMRKPENLRDGIGRFVELAQYSKSHLNRLVQKYYHISLHQYILEEKLETAYKQLTLSNVDVLDVAETLGYASLSHFNKIFKARYGITPSALRKKYGLRTV